MAPDPAWNGLAEREIARWRQTVSGLTTMHHIGSTSVPGLPAKPIIDLLPVFRDTVAQRDARTAIESLGYEWLGEYGLSGRVYARFTDKETGQRSIHAHGYVDGHPDVIRHLAFRDALRANATLRAAYSSIKAACAARHPEGGEGYGRCKSAWINKVEVIALERQK